MCDSVLYTYPVKPLRRFVGSYVAAKPGLRFTHEVLCTRVEQIYIIYNIIYHHVYFVTMLCTYIRVMAVHGHGCYASTPVPVHGGCKAAADGHWPSAYTTTAQWPRVAATAAQAVAAVISGGVGWRW